jgi:hypothetical protein
MFSRYSRADEISKSGSQPVAHQWSSVLVKAAKFMVKFHRSLTIAPTQGDINDSAQQEASLANRCGPRVRACETVNSVNGFEIRTPPEHRQSSDSNDTFGRVNRYFLTES